MFKSNSPINALGTFAAAARRCRIGFAGMFVSALLSGLWLTPAIAANWTLDWGTAAQSWPLTGWSTNTWPVTNGPNNPTCAATTPVVSNSRTFANAGGSTVDVRVTISIRYGCFINDTGSGVADYPSLDYSANGGATGAPADLELQVDFNGRTNGGNNPNVTVLYEFLVHGTNTPATKSIRGLTVRDVDRSTNTNSGWQDILSATATDGTTVFNPDFISQFVATPNWTCSPAANCQTTANTITAIGTASVPQADQSGWATFNFTSRMVRSMTFVYTPGDGGGNTDPFEQRVWLGSLAFSDAALTEAVVTDVTAYAENGQPWVEWQTASEIGTAGFSVLREDEAKGGFVRLNEKLLPPVIASTQGGMYRLRDPGAVAGETYTYWIEEVEAAGTLRRYGPYRVKVAARSASAGNKAVRLTQSVANKRADGFERIAHVPNGRAAEQSFETLQLKAAKSSSANTALRILVERDGVYTVDAGQIATALGVTLQQARTWVSQGKLRLQQKGQQVSWMAGPANNNLYFYGQAITGTDSVYTRYNMYLLDQANGQTMKVVSGKSPTGTPGIQPFRSRLHAEENVLPAQFLSTNPDGDLFYWNYVLADDPAEGAPAFPVPTPGVIRSGTATMSVTLQGATDLAPGNDHHAHLLVNGTEVGSAVWDGIRPRTLSASFNANLLAADGNNSVTVRGTLDPGVPYSVFWVNGFDVDYPRGYQASDNQLRLRSGGNAMLKVGGFGSSAIAVLDITDPRRPQWMATTSVTGATGGYAVSFVPGNANTDSEYVAAVAKVPAAVEGDTPSSTLKTSANNATYLVLTPASLRTGADSLAAYRSGRVVELQDIYDEFNYGIANPNAIRDFLNYANTNWKTHPRYVALVGKGTFDPKNYMGFGTNLFPVLMSSTPNGLFASDNRYVDFNNNGTPDIAIGRIPALVAADVTQYVTKLITYNSNRGPAKQALMVADNSDDGGNFTADSQAVAQVLQARGFTTIPAYLDQIPAYQVSQQIIGNLNSATGVGLFHYAGHGGVNLLADEDIFNNDDASQLTNSTRLAVFLAFTCAAGDGTYPGYDSLTETLLWRQGGGAVAAFAPTGLSDNRQAHILDLSLVNALVGTSASATLGDAAVAAVADLAKKGGERYMLEKYSVSGDPALKIHP
jgi:Peptidase family C25